MEIAKEKTKSINWAKYFDKIFCLHFIPQSARLPRLKSELSRVGILDSGIFQFRYTSPCKYDNIIWEKEKDIYLAPRPSFVNMCLETRRILAESVAFDYKRILILENDVAFLKDLSLLEQLLEETPSGYGIVQYDKFVNPEWSDKYYDDLKSSRISANYFESPHNRMWTSAACLGLFNKGIEQMLSLFNSRICATDIAYQLMTCRYAVAIKNLAVQIRFSGSNNESNSAPSRMDDIYRLQNINYSDYATPDGYDYGMLFNTDTNTLVTLNSKHKQP